MDTTETKGMATVYRYLKTGTERISEFRDQWKKLGETDREQLRAGVADGTLTY